MPRRRKPKSKRKQDAIRHNCGIAAWRRAAAEYLRRGRFVHLPKKGTPEHTAMKQRQKELMPIVQKEIDIMIQKEREEERQRKHANARRRELEIAELARRREEKRALARLNGTLSDCSDTDTDLDIGEAMEIEEIEEDDAMPEDIVLGSDVDASEFEDEYDGSVIVGEDEDEDMEINDYADEEDWI